MKKVLPLLLSIMVIFQSCKIYNSRSTTKEDALLFAGKVRVKSDQKASYKFEKLIEEENQLYGIGKKQSGKSKLLYNENIVNKNPNDKNVKILLTENLVNEIHLFSKGKTTALKGVQAGISVFLLILLIGGSVAILAVAFGG